MRLRIQLVPGSKKEGLEVLTDLAGEHVYKIKLHAKPIDGEANRALIDFLHILLDVPKRAIAIISGQTARLKVVEVEGNDEVIIEKLKATR